MAKKNTPAAESTHTHFGFDAHEETGKIIGPGTNPDEVKFEGDPAGPFYVHCKNGQPIETVSEESTAQEGWFVRFGGSKEEAHAFAARG